MVFNSSPVKETSSQIDAFPSPVSTSTTLEALHRAVADLPSCASPMPDYLQSQTFLLEEGEKLDEFLSEAVSKNVHRLRSYVTSILAFRPRNTTGGIFLSSVQDRLTTSSSSGQSSSFSFSPHARFHARSIRNTISLLLLEVKKSLIRDTEYNLASTTFSIKSIPCSWVA